MIITYADTPTIRVPMGPLSAIDGAALGSQSAYYGTRGGAALVSAIELALAELEKTQTARKVLIVVSDGNDADNEHAPAALAGLKTQATRAGIQTFGLIYHVGICYWSNTVLEAFVPQTKLLRDAETIEPALSDILARMADRQYLTFAGHDSKLDLGLPWDGQQHNLVLTIDKTDLEPVPITLSPIWKAHKAGFSGLIVLLSLLGAIILVAVGVKVFKQAVAPPTPLR
jgi:hypothetical protein